MRNRIQYEHPDWNLHKVIKAALQETIDMQSAPEEIIRLTFDAESDDAPGHSESESESFDEEKFYLNYTDSSGSESESDGVYCAFRCGLMWNSRVAIFGSSIPGNRM